ncbi:hypothetical protein LJC17_05055 [Acholeplasma sp. OttesenSCG-928-E16]|nr:hypothetical protein [Acholeplasma sp. OttesenSCG-928-E16]
MEYYNEDQLYKYFKETIKRDSMKKMDRLRKEIDAIKERELKRIDLEAKRQIDWTLGGELQEIKKDHQTKINQISINIDVKLMEIRAKFFEEIFDNVIAKLNKFTKKEEYYKLILKKVNDLIKEYPKEDIVFLVSKNDTQGIKALDCIKDNKKYQIQQTSDISIGGFIASFKDGVEVDETLDSKISDKKEDFIEKSRLFIRK